MGRKRRNWKARVKAENFNPNVLVDEPPNKPNRVDEHQWNNLLSFCETSDVKVIFNFL